MSKELAKQYNPAEVEDRTYKFWCDNKYFHAEVDPSKKPYTIVIPPPNITGQLHMGHALDNTLQDILIRWRRMQGMKHCGFRARIMLLSQQRQRSLRLCAKRALPKKISAATNF